MMERIYVEGFVCDQCEREAPCYQGAIKNSEGTWLPLYWCELCLHHLDSECDCQDCHACIALGCEEAWALPS